MPRLNATSEPGTCKHIEFTLAQLEKKRGAKMAFARGYRPAFSEVYLRYSGKRRVHFRAGTECPPPLAEAAAALFDAENDGMLPDDRIGELERFMTNASECGHDVRPMTMRSISSRGGAMRKSGRPSSRGCSPAVRAIPNCSHC